MKRTGLLLSLVFLLGAGAVFYFQRAAQLYQHGVVLPDHSEYSTDLQDGSLISTAIPKFEPSQVDVVAILDGAIFESSRARPQQPQQPEEVQEEVVEKPQPVSRLNVKVLGIILEDETGLVVVQSENLSRPQQIAIGDKVEGWTLVELSEFSAIFKKDDEEQRFNLGLD